MENEVVNNTLEKISDSIDINKSLEKTGSFLNRINFNEHLSDVGNGISGISGWTVKKISSAGLKMSGLSVKLITLIILFGLLYLAMHYGKKPVKYILIALIIFFMVSVIASIFIG